MDARLAIDTAVLLLYFFGIVALGLWAVDSLVGSSRFHRCSRNQRRHFSWNAGRGFQNEGILLRPARHWDDPGARVYSFHLYQAVLRLSRAEHLRVPDRALRNKNQEHGKRHLLVYARAGNRRSFVSWRRYHGGDLALSVSEPADQSQYLHLGHYLRDRHHDDLYVGRRHQGRSLD